MLWDIVFADGVLHEFEDNLVWRVAETIGVANEDRIGIRRRIAAEHADRPDQCRGLMARAPSRW